MTTEALLRRVAPRPSLLTLGLLAAALVPTAPAGGAVRLDATYGTHGATVVAFNGIGEVARGLVLLGTNKTVLGGGGCCQNLPGVDASGDLALARFLANGLPDGAFNGGTRLIDLPSGGGGEEDEELWGLAPAPSGKLVGVGQANGSDDGFLVARFLADGTLDKSFGGGDGWRTLNFGGFTAGLEAVVRKDNKIVVGGTLRIGNSARGLAIARLLANGSPDPQFGAGGLVKIFAQSGLGLFGDLMIDPDGKVVIFGRDGSAWWGVRLKPDGAPDATFGVGGHVRFPLPGSAPFASAIARAKDGKLIVGGGNSTGSDPASALGFAVGRLLANGQVDSTFGGGDGFVTTGSPIDEDEIFDLLVEPTGKIVAAGRIKNQPVLVRYNSNGTPDATFGVQGILTVSRPQGGSAVAVARDKTGRLYGAGNVGAFGDGFLIFRTTAK